VNTPVFLATLRQRFTSPMRLVLTATVFAFPLLLLAFVPRFGLFVVQTGTPYAFILGAGLIGQETSSGVMQLLFARPIRRWEYVFSRWLAVAAAIAGLIVAQLAIASLILMARGETITAREVLLVGFTDQVLIGVGILSVLVFFSSFLSGIGDVAAIVLGFITSQVLQGIGQITQRPPIARIGQELLRFVKPEIQTGLIRDLGAIPWYEVVSYFSTVSLCLAVAVVLINRREISYASE